MCCSLSHFAALFNTFTGSRCIFAVMKPGFARPSKNGKPVLPHMWAWWKTGHNMLNLRAWAAQWEDGCRGGKPGWGKCGARHLRPARRRHSARRPRAPPPKARCPRAHRSAPPRCPPEAGGGERRGRRAGGRRGRRQSCARGWAGGRGGGRGARAGGRGAGAGRARTGGRERGHSATFSSIPAQPKGLWPTESPLHFAKDQIGIFARRACAQATSEIAENVAKRSRE